MSCKFFRKEDDCCSVCEYPNTPCPYKNDPVQQKECEHRAEIVQSKKLAKRIEKEHLIK